MQKMVITTRAAHLNTVKTRGLMAAGAEWVQMGAAGVPEITAPETLPTGITSQTFQKSPPRHAELLSRLHREIVYALIIISFNRIELPKLFHLSK
jgi:hypothetical protein